MNLTKTIRKLPIDAVFNRAGHAYEDDHSKAAVKYDDEDMWVSRGVWDALRCMLSCWRKWELYITEGAAGACILCVP
jgi:hypothetical protein